ncbi:Methyltransferase-like protein 22 [Galemys pyrenaicus]|uniref:Methyltransferase-like protein 22 n=1 Tax=Galemys pyrenaicus TaxID=202257 RepID=A0A8J6A5Y1_GALPY|nr:Methyltransferase-like protein 22 [Galemys pyrenaicus]
MTRLWLLWAPPPIRLLSLSTGSAPFCLQHIFQLGKKKSKGPVRLAQPPRRQVTVESEQAPLSLSWPSCHGATGGSCPFGLPDPELRKVLLSCDLCGTGRLVAGFCLAMDEVTFKSNTVLSDVHLYTPNQRHLMVRLNSMGQPVFLTQFKLLWNQDTQTDSGAEGGDHGSAGTPESPPQGKGSPRSPPGSRRSDAACPERAGVQLDEDGDLDVVRRPRAASDPDTARPPRDKVQPMILRQEEDDVLGDEAPESSPIDVIKIEHTMATPLEDVGKQVWRGALLLADYVLSQPDLLRGRTVLELGAGMGLVSIVAATVAKTVYCTDVGTDLLAMCQRNTTLNSHLTAAGGGVVKVKELDWLKADLCTEPWLQPPPASLLARPQLAAWSRALHCGSDSGAPQGPWLGSRDWRPERARAARVPRRTGQAVGSSRLPAPGGGPGGPVLTHSGQRGQTPPPAGSGQPLTPLRKSCFKDVGGQGLTGAATCPALSMSGPLASLTSLRDVLKPPAAGTNPEGRAADPASHSRQRAGARLQHRPVPPRPLARRCSDLAPAPAAPRSSVLTPPQPAPRELQLQRREHRAPFRPADPAAPFSWSEEDLADLYEHTTVLLAAEVFYDDDLTDALFRTLSGLALRLKNACTAVLSVEKRLNFTLRHLDVTCEAYDHFRSALRRLEGRTAGPLRFAVEPVEASFPQRLVYERIRQLAWHPDTPRSGPGPLQRREKPQSMRMAADVPALVRAGRGLGVPGAGLPGEPPATRVSLCLLQELWKVLVERVA